MQNTWLFLPSRTTRHTASIQPEELILDHLLQANPHTECDSGARVFLSCKYACVRVWGCVSEMTCSIITQILIRIMCNSRRRGTLAAPLIFTPVIKAGCRYLFPGTAHIARHSEAVHIVNYILCLLLLYVDWHVSKLLYTFLFCKLTLSKHNYSVFQYLTGISNEPRKTFCK